MTQSDDQNSPTVTASRFEIRKRVVEAIAVPEDDGGYSAYIPTLPGVRSQSDGLLEVWQEIEEALRAALASYEEDGEDVPWVENYPEEPCKQHRSKWIMLD